MNAADGEERGTVRNETEATGKEGEAREQERKDRSGIEKKKKKKSCLQMPRRKPLHDTQNVKEKSVLSDRG